MKKSELGFAVALLPVDYVMVVLAALSAYQIRYAPLVLGVRPVTFTLPFFDFLLLVCAFAPVWNVLFALLGLYTTHTTHRFSEDVRKIVFGSSAAMLFVLVFGFSVREIFVSRFIILTAWVFSWLFVMVARLVFLWIRRACWKKGIAVRYAVAVGKTQGLISMKEKYGIDVHARFEEVNEVLFRKVKELREQGRCDDVLLWGGIPRGQVKQIIEFCDQEQIQCTFVPDLFDIAVYQLQIHSLDDYPFFEVKRTPLEGWGRVYKRLFDVICSFVLIVLTSPLLLLTAALIKLDSKGPVFFARLEDGKKTTRVGQDQQEFWYFKFRSMQHNSHHLRYTVLADQNIRKDSPLVKIPDDPRITRVGKWIRRFSIDELPELFLVFLGHMSLVGPRPHLPEEVARYQGSQRKVFRVKPGITGLAQISGRSDLAFEEENRLDLLYIHNWSIWLDIKILLKTPLAVFSKRKAL